MTQQQLLVVVVDPTGLPGTNSDPAFLWRDAIVTQ